MEIDAVVHPKPFPDLKFLFSRILLDIMKIYHENFQEGARTSNSHALEI